MTSRATQSLPPRPTNPHDTRPRDSSHTHRRSGWVGAAITVGGSNDGQDRSDVREGDLRLGRQGASGVTREGATREGGSGTCEPSLMYLKISLNIYRWRCNLDHMMDTPYI
jgi:hypothetical protein